MGIKLIPYKLTHFWSLHVAQFVDAGNNLKQMWPMQLLNLSRELFLWRSRKLYRISLSKMHFSRLFRVLLFVMPLVRRPLRVLLFRRNRMPPLRVLLYRMPLARIKLSKELLAKLSRMPLA